jgi:raffinose synthase
MQLIILLILLIFIIPLSSSVFTFAFTFYLPSKLTSSFRKRTKMVPHRWSCKDDDDDVDDDDGCDSSVVSRDDKWAFVSSTKITATTQHTNHFPAVHLMHSSQFGNVYNIDLNDDDNDDDNNIHRQVKPRHQCMDGESSSRYVFQLGMLKNVMRRNSMNRIGNDDGDDGDDDDDDVTTNSRDDKILCLHRHKIWWMKPVFVTHAHDGDNDDDGCKMIIPPETIFILYKDKEMKDVEVNDDNGVQETDGIYRLILPLILPDGNGCTSCSLRSSAVDTNSIELHSETGGKVALYCGAGLNPFTLIEDGIRVASLLSRPAHKETDPTFTTKSSINSTAIIPTRTKDCILPPFAQKLGFCTWNAFYTQLNGEKIISAVQTLQQKDIPVKWMIIDDGWQHTTNDYADDGMQWGERLLSVHRSSPLKFTPEERVHIGNIEEAKAPLLSLSTTVAKLKLPKQSSPDFLSNAIESNEGCGLDHVFAWHALSGYWLGLSSEIENDSYVGPKTSLYYPHFSSSIIENDASLIKELSIQEGIGIAENATLFYNQYHSYLESCGFDGVKVDAQGVSGVLKPYRASRQESDKFDNEPHRHYVSHHLQNALASSVNTSFSEKLSKRYKNEQDINGELQYSSNIIMCMCHSPDIIYRLSHLYPNSKPLMRASDDFYPKNDYCHGSHLVACAFNSLLLGGFAIPDWDMFWTQSTISGEMHAMARAISGGPIYFSDKPDEANPSIIERLACKNGMILPCCNYARPTRKSILNDPLAKDCSPLILWNQNGADINQDDLLSGVIGIFHIGASGSWCYKKLDFVPTSQLDETDMIQVLSVCPLDIEPFRHQKYKNVKFVVMSSQSGLLGESVSVNESIDLRIEHMQSLLIHFLPIYFLNCLDMVVMGITSLYNHAGAIRTVKCVEKEHEPSLDGDNKLNIIIETIGCGNFFLAYKFNKLIMMNNTFRVIFNGETVEHYFIDGSIQNDKFPRTQREEEMAYAFAKHGYHVHCINIPHQNSSIVGTLEIIV